MAYAPHIIIRLFIIILDDLSCFFFCCCCCCYCSFIDVWKIDSRLIYVSRLHFFCIWFSITEYFFVWSLSLHKWSKKLISFSIIRELMRENRSFGFFPLKEEKTKYSLDSRWILCFYRFKNKHFFLWWTWWVAKINSVFS